MNIAIFKGKRALLATDNIPEALMTAQSGGPLRVDLQMLIHLLLLEDCCCCCCCCCCAVVVVVLRLPPSNMGGGVCLHFQVLADSTGKKVLLVSLLLRYLLPLLVPIFVMLQRKNSTHGD
jgi:hypothetical protein